MNAVTEVDPAGAQLVDWGRAVRITIPGRSSGRPRETIVGFVEASDGALIVAAGSPDAAWARNLLAAGRATVTVGERSWPVSAEQLHDAAFSEAIRALILRYGTPSEGLGSGPAFRLRPAIGSSPAPDPASPTGDGQGH